MARAASGLALLLTLGRLLLARAQNASTCNLEGGLVGTEDRHLFMFFSHGFVCSARVAAAFRSLFLGTSTCGIVC